MIKVYLQRGFDNTGKGKFLWRLAQASIDIGVLYTDKPNNCDVILDLAYWHGKEKGIPRILRIDGAMPYNSNKIRTSAKQADAVIWQSQFCKRMLMKHLDIKTKKSFVIHNGADPKQYSKHDSIGYEVLLSGKWDKDTGPRREKRLKEMLEVAEICVCRQENIRFIVAGDSVLPSTKHDRILRLGNVNDRQLSSLISSSTMMLNLSYCDWCPNAVVEYLVAGKPVMCSNGGGGIPEIVKDSGWILDLDRAINPFVEPPNKIDTLFVADRLLERVTEEKIVYRPELYIAEIAAQYKNAILEVLNG